MTNRYFALALCPVCKRFRLVVLILLLVAVGTMKGSAQSLSFAPTSPSSRGTISVRELQISSEARDSFERGLGRLSKNDPGGSLNTSPRQSLRLPTSMKPTTTRASRKRNTARTRKRCVRSSQRLTLAMDIIRARNSAMRWCWVELGTLPTPNVSSGTACKRMPIFLMATWC